MQFEVNTVLPAPTDDRIQRFEQTCRVKLPIDYVSALKHGNGGVPLKRKFVQGERERLVERMLCLLPSSGSPNGWFNIPVVMTQLDCRISDDEDLVGARIIPIAILFAGDFVCLDFRKDLVNPVIAVWDHEASDDFQPVLETVAPSFTAFDQLLF